MACLLVEIHIRFLRQVLLHLTGPSEVNKTIEQLLALLVLGYMCTGYAQKQRPSTGYLSISVRFSFGS